MTDIGPQLLAFVQDEVSTLGEPLDGTTDLLLSGAVDSLGVVRITQWIEDATGMAVDPGDVTLENFQTIDRMVAYISRHTREVSS